MPRLTIATCQNPYAFSQEPDDVLLVSELHWAGIVADLVPWDDPTYNWSQSDLVLIRSTWDYPRDPLSFLAWTSRVVRVTMLWNPATLLRWNAHKTYLLDQGLRPRSVFCTSSMRRTDKFLMPPPPLRLPQWREEK